MIRETSPADRRLHTLIIDNFDSFTFNLFQYIGELGGNPETVRNDAITLDEIQRMAPTHIVLSPGPGHPADERYFGICTAVIREYGPRIPLLGVCLGHQGIVAAFGGKIIEAPKILHGKASSICHEGKGILHGLPNPFPAMRYHSLAADPETFPTADLGIIARSAEGTIMAFQHRRFPLFGIQFHPESVGTPCGKELLANFLALSTSEGVKQ